MGHIYRKKGFRKKGNRHSGIGRRFDFPSRSLQRFRYHHIADSSYLHVVVYHYFLGLVHVALKEQGCCHDSQLLLSREHTDMALGNGPVWLPGFGHKRSDSNKSVPAKCSHNNDTHYYLIKVFK